MTHPVSATGSNCQRTEFRKYRRAKISRSVFPLKRVRAAATRLAISHLEHPIDFHSASPLTRHLRLLPALVASDDAHGLARGIFRLNSNLTHNSCKRFRIPKTNQAVTHSGLVLREHLVSGFKGDEQ